MKATALESSVILRMLADRGLQPTRREVDTSTMEVSERDYTGVGFITSFSRSSGCQLFPAGASARWGKVVGRLNSEVDVDFVGYVDDGYVTAVEGVTFGGEPWPAEVLEFDLTDVPNR